MDTYEGGIATPLIAHWPKGMAELSQGKPSPGRIVRDPGHVIDIMPTLLDVAGADYPEKADGKPLLALEGRGLKSLLTVMPAEPPREESVCRLLCAGQVRHRREARRLMWGTSET